MNHITLIEHSNLMELQGSCDLINPRGQLRQAELGWALNQAQPRYYEREQRLSPNKHCAQVSITNINPNKLIGLRLGREKIFNLLFIYFYNREYR